MGLSAKKKLLDWGVLSLKTFGVFKKLQAERKAAADSMIRTSILKVFGDFRRIFSDVSDRACVLGNPCQQEKNGCFSSIYLCDAVFS